MRICRSLFICSAAFVLVLLSVLSCYGHVPMDDLKVAQLQVVPPVYPLVALSKGFEGLVFVEVRIGTNGEVE
jgi:hypothetical protein